MILTALVLSWLGDVLLLSKRGSFLLVGIAAFFGAHIAFAAAFGWGRSSSVWLAVSFLCMGIAAVFILRWLWQYLAGPFKPAVIIYLAAVVIMTSLALAFAVAIGSPNVGIGAVVFAVSDISVAGDRFVERKVINRIWGLPLYYFAQLLFAISVDPVRQ